MAPPPRHERYNAKARGSVAGGSSHKKRKRPAPKEIVEDHGEEVGEGDDGSESLAAIAKRMSGGEGISGKRRKRLESYIVSDPISEPGILKLNYGSDEKAAIGTT